MISTSGQVLLLSATLALASASFAPSCEECNAAAAGLLVGQVFLQYGDELNLTLFSTSHISSQARLTSPESIAEQTGILISQVCPQAADAAVCEAVSLIIFFIKDFFANQTVPASALIFISNPRVSPNGGATWPTVSSPLSSELATPASSLDSARCCHTSLYLWFNCTIL